MVKIKTQEPTGSTHLLTKANDQMARTITQQTITTTGGGGGGDGESNGDQQIMQRNDQNLEKFQALKQRKTDLEKLLNEKTLLLQKLQRQEQQIIAGDLTYDLNNLFSDNNNNNNGLRRISATASFKLPSSNKSYQISKEFSGSVGDVEKKLQQEIVGVPATGYRLDMALPKMIRSASRADYDQQHTQHRHLPLALQQSPISSHSKSPIHSINDHHQLTNDGCSLITSDLPVNLTTNSTLTATSSQRYGSCSNVTNYYIMERQNSMKSLQMLQTQQQQQQRPIQFNRLSPKQQRYDEQRPTTIVNSEAYTVPVKNHRIDYDNSTFPNNRLLHHPNLQSMSNRSSHLYEMRDSTAAAAAATAAAFINNNTQKKVFDCGFTTDSGVTRNLKSPTTNGRNSVLPSNDTTNAVNLINYYASGSIQPLNNHQYAYDDALFLAQRPFSSAYRKTMTDIETLSVNSSVFNEYPKSIGLGGYWRIVGNQRIWYPIDTSFDSGIEAKSIGGSAKAKKSNTIATTPTKSIGNFDIITDFNSSLKDDLVDKISLSSFNSGDGNKKQREKQWVETSLDSPQTKIKQSTETQQQLQNLQKFPNSRTAYARNETNSPMFSNPLNRQSTQSLTCVNNNTNNDDMQYAVIKSPTTRTQSPLQSFTSSSQPIPQPRTLLPATTLSAPSSPHAAATTIINSHSPIIANLSRHESIRIESPKNVTVIQQAVFMPYKEVTKPFEMSDFYKYSTKFRQTSEKQQQQQQQQQSQQQVQVE